MANRTVQLTGYGFGSTPASVVATYNGATVYTGVVPTLNESVPAQPNPDIINDTTVLFSFDIPIETDGVQEMTIQVTNGTVVFANVVGNYCKLFRKSPEPFFYSSGDTGYNLISTDFDGSMPHPTAPALDARSNVTINGVAQNPDTSGLEGPWWWTVNSTATLSYDLTVAPGM
jgi:hypothetical protein